MVRVLLFGVKPIELNLEMAFVFLVAFEYLLIHQILHCRRFINIVNLVLVIGLDYLHLDTFAIVSGFYLSDAWRPRHVRVLFRG